MSKQNNQGEQVQMLKEMLESMSDSLENMKEVVKQQYDLKEVVENSKKKEQFKEFLTGIEEEAKQMTKQIKRMEDKILKMDYVIGCCESSEEIKDVVENLVQALGVLQQ